MAYTDVWNPAFNATPAGSAQLSGGDDSIRQFKLAVYERLTKMLVDINADPPTLIASIIGTIGAQTNRPMLFGPNIFEARNDEDDATHQNPYFQLTDPGLTGQASLYLPHGITIKKLEAAMDRGLGTDCSLELYKVNYLTGAVTVLDTVLRNVAGLGLSAGAIANPPGIGEVVDSNTYHYGCRFFGTPAPFAQHKIYAVKLTIDSPGVSALP